MSDDDSNKSKEDMEAEVWSAINAFETILEAMPRDRPSLETLSHAYGQIGDHTRAREYMVRLVDVLLDDGDMTAAKEVVAKLRPHVDENEEIAGMVSRYDAVADEAGSEPEVAEISPEADEPEDGGLVAGVDYKLTVDISPELEFAYNLLGQNELTQDEYSSVVSDLTEMSARENVTVSMLHVLYDRGFRNLERVLGYVSKECNTPLITVSYFNLEESVVTRLPFPFIQRRGALCFEQVEGESLVAILNPYDTALRQEVEKLLGGRCYFYLVSPGDFDESLTKVQTILSNRESAKAEAAKGNAGEESA